MIRDKISLVHHEIFDYNKVEGWEIGEHMTGAMFKIGNDIWIPFIICDPNRLRQGYCSRWLASLIASRTTGRIIITRVRYGVAQGILQRRGFEEVLVDLPFDRGEQAWAYVYDYNLKV